MPPLVHHAEFHPRLCDRARSDQCQQRAGSETPLLKLKGLVGPLGDGALCRAVGSLVDENKEQVPARRDVRTMTSQGRPLCRNELLPGRRGCVLLKFLPRGDTSLSFS